MKKDNSFNADIYLNLNLEFWQELEIHCVAECCGINAFDFSQEEIIKTIKYYDSSLIKNNLNELLKNLETTNLKYTSSIVFNDYSKTGVFIERIKGIINTIK